MAWEVVKALLIFGKWPRPSLIGLVEAKVSDTKYVSATLLPPKGDWGATKARIFLDDPHLQLRFHLLLDEDQLGFAKALQRGR